MQSKITDALAVADLEYGRDTGLNNLIVLHQNFELADEDLGRDIPGNAKLFDEADVVENLGEQQMEVVETPSPTRTPSLSLVSGAGLPEHREESDSDGGDDSREDDCPEVPASTTDPLPGCSTSRSAVPR
ncbi:unnamed protein product [Orchesella dallaii]|uniref:Uncharacterized protein n=1 Tax=Orchesella dallaii TaxID=48710 RepID=A0ABP1R3X3_9HEXA